MNYVMIHSCIRVMNLEKSEQFSSRSHAPAWECIDCESRILLSARPHLLFQVDDLVRSLFEN
jgi:DNA-directed RNA polymerase subunit RPC12/RpoP